ncbi:MAG: hypothetical protein BMS9Abin33_0724 [Gammaproteobacteria bacterium]|nr:MAG: hypothetical protein BMS9Abin33_0724 [Gammaproteobacteria bacterium]
MGIIKIRKVCNRVSCAGATVFLITLLWAIQPANAEWVEWIADAELGVQRNNNISQSFFESDKKSDSVFLPSVALGRYYQLMDTTRLSLTANSWVRTHKTYDRLNSITSGITVGVRHKFGIGPEVPWIRADAYAGYRDVRDDVRDGMQYTMSLRMGKRFTPRLDGSLGYVYSLRDGGNGEPTMKNAMFGISTEVFDQENQTLLLETNFLITRDVLLTAGYSYLYGDFDSFCSAANFDAVWAVEDVKAVAVDNVFDGFVYRIRGTRTISSLNLSYALSGHASLNLGYLYQSVKGDVLGYNSSIAQTTFMYRY